jgi:tetratricopeptide (TPR) repeat protein
MEKGRVEDAIAEFNAVEELHGYSASAMIDVGVYEQTHGHVHEAIEQYKQSLKFSRDPNSKAVALTRLGSAFLQLGDLQDAKLAYTYALQQSPDNGTALLGSGLLAGREGDFASAVTQISHAMKVAPTDSGYLLLEQALRKAGHAAEADAADKEAQQISHDFAQAQQTAAEAMASAGMKSE